MAAFKIIGVGVVLNKIVNFGTLYITQVYCRVRPLHEDELESCAEVLSDTVLQITPPSFSLAYKSGHRNPVSLLDIWCRLSGISSYHVYSNF